MDPLRPISNLFDFGEIPHIVKSENLLMTSL